MSTVRRAGARLRAEDSGLGMIELLVAIVISGALLAIVASFFLTTTRATISSDATRVAATTAGNIASQVSSAIRFATPNAVSGRDVPDTALISASGSSVTLYSLLDSSADALTPLKVRYEVVDGQWKESRWLGTTSGGYTTFSSSTPTRSRVLGGLAVPQSRADQRPFVFLAEDGSVIGDGSSLTAAQIADVRVVRINVAIRGTDTGPVTMLTSDVGMPNLGYRGVAR